MKLPKRTCLVTMLALCSVTVWAQPKPNLSDVSPDKSQSTSEAESPPSKKEQFDLYLGMLKAYYDAIESRAEKSVALLLVVVGWLITSETARKSLKNEPPLFWGTIVILTLLVAFLGYNLSHFLVQFRSIEQDIGELKFFEPKTYRRYHMTGGILLFYLLPVLMLYVLILLLLVQIKYGFLSQTGSSDKGEGTDDRQ